ncbi:MAG: hypothetical protein ACK456_03045 [Pseudanabaenaceae cyanobacterium]|jgi:hypothetical protein
MTVEFSLNLNTTGLDTLQGLRQQLKNFLAEYEGSVVQAREQLTHLDALLTSLPADAAVAAAPVAAVAAPAPVAPKPLRGRAAAKAKAAAAEAAEAAAATVKVKGKPGRKPAAAKVVAPAPAVGTGRGHRRSSLPTLPAYAGLTLTKAISRILTEHKGKCLSADDVVYLLYGDEAEKFFAVAKDRVTKNLSKGKIDQLWDRVPGQLGYYTLSLAQVSATELANPKPIPRKGRQKKEAAAPEAAPVAKKKEPKVKEKAPKVGRGRYPRKPKAEAPAAAATPAPALPRRAGRSSSLAMRGPYQGNTLTEAIAKILQERKGEFVTADSIVKALYGDLSNDTFRLAKDRVTKNLSKGKLDGLWERVPHQLGYYTLSMAAVKD